MASDLLVESCEQVSYRRNLGQSTNIGGGDRAGCRATDRIEVILESGFIPTDAAKWSKMLGEAGFSSVRLRSGKSSESPTVETHSGSVASYRVVGILNANNQLTLPQGRFGLSDRARIEEWLRKLATTARKALP